MQRINTNYLALVVVTLLIVVAAGIGFKPIIQNINLGLDLQGGIHVVLEAVDSPRHRLPRKESEGAGHNSHR